MHKGEYPGHYYSMLLRSSLVSTPYVHSIHTFWVSYILKFIKRYHLGEIPFLSDPKIEWFLEMNEIDSK